MAGLAGDLETACGEPDWTDAQCFAEYVPGGMDLMRNYVADLLEFAWDWVEDVAGKLAAYGSLTGDDLYAWYEPRHA